MDKKLAKISSASLSIQDTGFFTFNIIVDYEEGLSQCIGGITLDTYCPVKLTRVGTAYGLELIRRLLITLGVNDFSEMEGKYLWVLGEESSGGLAFSVKGVSALNLDKTGTGGLLFDEVLKEFGG